MVDDDGSGRKLDPSKSTNKSADRRVDESSRWILVVSPERRPRPGEGEQQALRFLVGERVDHRRPYISEYRWELLGVDRRSVVEDDAQRPPIGRGHPSGSFVECSTCPVDRVRQRVGAGTVAVADVGRAGLSSTGLSVSQTLCAPAQPFGDLLQRLDLHAARLVRHKVPVSDGPSSPRSRPPRIAGR